MHVIDALSHLAQAGRIEVDPRDPIAGAALAAERGYGAHRCRIPSASHQAIAHEIVAARDRQVGRVTDRRALERAACSARWCGSVSAKRRRT